MIGSLFVDNIDDEEYNHRKLKGKRIMPTSTILRLKKMMYKRMTKRHASACGGKIYM